MSKTKRALALCMCIGMILVLFTSSAYLVHEAGHECAGDHCETCKRIQEVRAILSSFLVLALAWRFVSVILPFRRTLLAAGDDGLRPRCTLVSWKVRLDN